MQLVDIKESNFGGPRKLASTFSLLLMILFFLSSCKSSSPDPDSKPPLAVRTIAIRTGPIKETIKYVGTVHSRNEIKVLARVAGKVSDLPIEEGETAKRNAPLAQITAPEMGARVIRLRADVARVGEDSAFVCQQSQMDQALFKSGTISKIVADTSLQKCRNSEAALRAAKAGLKETKSLSGNTVERAPFDGKVLQWLTEPGENTMPGRPILMFGDESMEVRVKVHEKDVRAGIQKGTGVIMVREDLDLIRGAVSFVSPMAIGPGRMIEVRIPVKNTDISRLQHGISIDVSFVLREQSEAVMVPVNALSKKKKVFGVFLVQDEIARWTNVTTSIKEDGWIAVEADIKNGDRVVVGNLDVVRDGGTVFSVDYGRNTQ